MALCRRVGQQGSATEERETVSDISIHLSTGASPKVATLGALASCRLRKTIPQICNYRRCAPFLPPIVDTPPNFSILCSMASLNGAPVQTIRALLVATGGALCFSMVGCEKPTIREIETGGSPTPIQQSAPHPSVQTPSPEPPPIPPATPLATPEARIRQAPEGVFYLTKSISISHDYGIRRYPEGTEVRVIDRANGKLRVSAGDEIIEASEEGVTSDLDVLDAIRAKQTANADQMRIKVAEAAEARKRWKQEELEASREYHGKLAQERIQLLRRTVLDLEARVKMVEREIEEAERKSEARRVRRYYSDNSGYYYTWQTRYATSIMSPDASKIDELRNHYESMKRHLISLEAKHKTNQ